MTTREIEPLTIGDQPFLVASMIERCPKTMMLRELLMNAIEAASKAPEDQRRVELRAQRIGGVHKLAIWNTGPGMSGDELHAICNIAASVGKEKSLDSNFGMGAKVASLPSNKIGLRYRSCKNGIVSQVTLCQRDGEYGRLRHDLGDGSGLVEILDVTENSIAEGLDTTLDWTEVVLFGNRPEQDTTVDPYDSNPVVPGQWIADTMYHRFYRIPGGVTIRLFPPTHKLTGPRYFETIPARHRFFERHESVAAPSGEVIHYFYDAPLNDSSHNRSVSGAMASDLSICGVVFKDELYEVRKGRNWTINAPIFGIPFGAKHISVHIELPSNAPVRPEAYRQFLQYRDGDQRRVEAEDFSQLVRELRPKWLIELIESYAPSDSSSNDEIRDELQRLLNSLRVHSRTPRPMPDGELMVERGPGNAAQIVRGGTSSSNTNTPRTPKPDDLSVIPIGAKRASLSLNMERAPKLIELRELDDIDQKGLKGRAGRYYPESGEIYLNMLYPSIQEMAWILEQEYASSPDVDFVRRIALQLSERTIKFRVGRAVVFALAKQMNREWTKEDMAKAFSPESLSLAADDFVDALQNARRKIGKTLRTNGSEAAIADAGLTEDS